MKHKHLLTQNVAENQQLLNLANTALSLSNITLPPSGSSVVLLLSGGLDSTSLWFMLMHKYRYTVYPIYIQRSDLDQQLSSIQYYFNIFNKMFPNKCKKVHVTKKIDMFSFRDLKSLNVHKNPEFFLKNTLVSRGLDSYKLWLVSTPTRLGHYLSTAMDYLLYLRFKKELTVEAIFLGIVPEDRYCRESTLTIIRLFNATFSAILGDSRLRFLAPIDKKNNFFISRKNLVSYPQHFGIDISTTWSCVYIDRKMPCGKCNGCKNRKMLIEKSSQPTTKSAKKFITYVSDGIARIKKKIAKKQRIQMNDKIIINSPLYIHQTSSTTFLVSNNLDIIMLNETGAVIWEILKKRPKNYREIVGKLYKKYPLVKREIVRNDAESFIIECLSNSLCTIA